ncbi:MAG: hypothetical protein WD648_08740 [Planctomycetaceae bacterium]
MNKAFVKDSEDSGNRCPKCGTAGPVVFPATLDAHIPAELRDRISSTAFFCPQPTCPVAYFDQFERTIVADGLLRPVYPKHPDAPICPCFGLTSEDIEADVQDGVVTRVREHLRRAQSDEAHCTTASPSGQSCIAAVQRYFMQFRTG